MLLDGGVGSMGACSIVDASRLDIGVGVEQREGVNLVGEYFGVEDGVLRRCCHWGRRYVRRGGIHIYVTDGSIGLRVLQMVGEKRMQIYRYTYRRDGLQS